MLRRGGRFLVSEYEDMGGNESKIRHQGKPDMPPSSKDFLAYPWGWVVIPAVLAVAVAMAKHVWIPLIFG